MSAMQSKILVTKGYQKGINQNINSVQK